MRIVSKKLSKCVISIDVENILYFDNISKYEVSYKALDLIIAFDAVMEKQNHFTRK